MNEPISQTATLSNGSEIYIETGRLAKQANGSVVVKSGDTMLLATVVSKEEASANVDFLPLSVDYQEKYASTGRFPGGFFKREARPSEYEILISRLVDRALRPLFPKDYHSDTQVLVTLLSGDANTNPDALACLAASAAIAVSNLPFNGPVAEARVGRVNGQLVINPSISDIANSDIDIMVAATEESIVMVEGEMKEVSEQDLLEAMKMAHIEIKKLCVLQKELAAKVEKSQPKREYCHEINDDAILEDVRKATFDKALEAARAGITDKHLRKNTFKAIKEEYLATFDEEKRAEIESLVGKYYHQVERDAVRHVILHEGIRLDNRKTDEIRPIWMIVDYLPSAHGSAVFTRGETQSLTTVTLGSKLDEQIIDGAIFEGKNNFLLHYNFPPFSTGEVKMMRGTSRREVGHGNLAMRALKAVMPTIEENPYTIRIVSDVLESNGSSSMATVCAGTLALFDAGVKLRKPVSGIAMGLITDESGKFAVLSDILGDEDHLGDMDFKVTGTRDGITACQMDIKVKGLTYEILLKALEQAKAGRLHILGEMTKTISEPRADYKPHVPRIVKMFIPKEFIGAVIGPGGKIIQEMQSSTGTTIVIEEVGDQGVIDIVSNDKASVEEVIRRIKAITTVLEPGETYDGIVKSILPFGAVVEILPGKEGLLHISEIDWRRIEKLEDVMQVGDKVKVKLIEIDKRSNKLKLSRKALLPRPPKKDE
ncbi:MAG: polyribonucleotide nucleotidyltransferase [Bacteroidetes bacterium]|nr:polyribonucleotide nucleotidyltransferase [Bacteroidota bacterium]MBU1717997.1 polyribonucleotide nucleotidyltransferase [Bacteroidota bacterium]